MAAKLEATAVLPMASWRCWLFNQLRRLEERSIARTLGLPPERVFLVEDSGEDE